MRLRHTRPSEKIEFFAHRGECRYCRPKDSPGIVVMLYDIEKVQPRLDCCYCLYCGQRYYVEVEGSVEEWVNKQWEQKANLEWREII